MEDNEPRCPSGGWLGRWDIQNGHLLDLTPEISKTTLWMPVLMWRQLLRPGGTEVIWILIKRVEGNR